MIDMVVNIPFSALPVMRQGRVVCRRGIDITNTVHRWGIHFAEALGRADGSIVKHRGGTSDVQARLGLKATAMARL